MIGKDFFVTLACSLSLLSYGLTISVAGPAMEGIQRTFSVAAGAAGFLFTVLSVGLILTVLLSGYLIGRWSLKGGGVLGQGLLTAGLALCAAADTYPAGMAAFFLMGMGGGCIEIATNTTVAALHRENRATALNLLHFCFGVGALSGPLISGWLIETGAGWQAAFSVIAAFSGLVTATLAVSRFPRDADPGRMTRAVAATLMGSGYMRLICLAVVLYVGIEMAITSWAVLFMERTLGATPFSAGAKLSYFWTAMTFGRLLCAGLSRRLSSRDILVGLTLPACGAMVLFVLAPSAMIAGLALAMTGLCFSGLFPVLVALCGNRFPQIIGTGTLILMAFMGVGLMVFPWLTGVLAESLSLKSAMAVLVLALAALAAAALRIRNLTPRRSVP
ncbi:MAG: MFS transporter [Desulfobacterales bacterium]|nr:MFS transporter [Desulfobacterales bacterium]